MIPEFETGLIKGAGLLNIDLSRYHIRSMTHHVEQLILWNKKINLTAIKTPQSIAEKHFVDSMAAAACIPHNATIADLGSGGGFPGIPLTVLRPDLTVVLIDASRKKVNFLKHVIRTLQLRTIHAIHARVEDLHNHPDFSKKFDMVISRAFTNLEKFTCLAGPFLIDSGIICAMKGKNAEQEITEPVKSRFRIEQQYYQLPFEKSERYIYLLRKKR